MKNLFDKPFEVYILLLVLSAWGGVCDCILNKRKHYVTKLIVSVFIGVLTALYCFHKQIPLELTSIYVGVASLFSAKVIVIAKDFLEKRFAKNN